MAFTPKQLHQLELEQRFTTEPIVALYYLRLSEDSDIELHSRQKKYNTLKFKVLDDGTVEVLIMMNGAVRERLTMTTDEAREHYIEHVKYGFVLDE